MPEYRAGGKMNKLKIVVITLLTTLVFSQSFVFAKEERFGITTYYPSPRAAYKELLLYPNNTPTICNGDEDRGKIYYNSNTKRLEVCSYDNLLHKYIITPGGANATIVGGCDLWNLNATHLYNNNTGSVFMNQTVASESLSTNTVFQINGRYQATTNNEIYPIRSTSSGTYWYANYQNFGGRNAINIGAYYPALTRFAPLTINEVPDYLGLVGVGVRLPKAKLHVAYPSTYTDDWLIFLADTENTYTGTYDYNEPGLAVTRNGDVGIGTYGPSAKLEIVRSRFDQAHPALSVSGMPMLLDVALAPGSANMWYRQYLGFNAWFNGASNVWQTAGDSANNGAALITSTQIMGDLKFTVLPRDGGSGRIINSPVYNNAQLYIQSSGNVIVNGTGGGLKFTVNGTAGGTQCWANASDERLKKNVATIENAIGKIVKLRPVSFEWKQKGFGKPGRSLGLIAQEVKDIIPEVVIDGDGYYYIEYASMVGLLIEGIKDQQKEIASLQKEIAQIEAEL